MSRLTRARMLAGAAAAALAALGVFVSTSAGSTSSGQTAQRSGSILAKQSVLFRTQPAATTATTPYVYEASKLVSLSAGHFAAGTIKCPSSHPKPVSGLFQGSTPNVFVSASFPSKGGWFTRIANASSTTAAKVQIGAVCGV